MQTSPWWQNPSSCAVFFLHSLQRGNSLLFASNQIPRECPAGSALLRTSGTHVALCRDFSSGPSGASWSSPSGNSLIHLSGFLLVKFSLLRPITIHFAPAIWRVPSHNLFLRRMLLLGSRSLVPALRLRWVHSNCRERSVWWWQFWWHVSPQKTPILDNKSDRT